MAASPMTRGEGGSPVDLSKDFEFRLEFDIEEDIEGELENFVRLARLGLASKAREYFQETLRSHVDLFPVFAEYAEFLVAESEYSELLDLLPTVRDNFSGDELCFLKLLTALANIHVLGLEKYPYNIHEWNAMLASKRLMSDQLDETQLHCLDIYLRILVHLSARGISLSANYTQPPILPEMHETESWRGFVNLVPRLAHDHRDWEAHNLTRLLFAVCQFEEAKGLYNESISNLMARSIETATGLDEMDLMIRASITNRYLKFRLDRPEFNQIGSIEEELTKLEEAIADDLWQIFPDFPMDQSRHSEEYLQNFEKLTGKLALFRNSRQSKDQDTERRESADATGHSWIRSRNRMPLRQSRSIGTTSASSDEQVDGFTASGRAAPESPPPESGTPREWPQQDRTDRHFTPTELSLGAPDSSTTAFTMADQDWDSVTRVGSKVRGPGSGGVDRERVVKGKPAINAARSPGLFTNPKPPRPSVTLNPGSESTKQI